MTVTARKPAAIILPALTWKPTRAKESRDGQKIVRVVVHRWGVAYTTPHAEAVSYHGVLNWFESPANQASAHVVFPGSAVPGHATQMIEWAEAAWAEAAYNRSSVEIESADAIWLGHDPHGFQQLARIVAFLLKRNGLPAIYSAEKGFCRHADLGAAGGGHTACPTTDMHLWLAFASLVKHEYQRGGFRKTWGR